MKAETLLPLGKLDPGLAQPESPLDLSGVAAESCTAEAIGYHAVLMEETKDDPFQVLDQEGIGEFVKIAVEKGRSKRPGLKIGICGEHGGEPRSVEFCYNAGLDYVSCSPYRVPIARLAAAQAAVRNKSS